MVSLPNRTAQKNSLVSPIGVAQKGNGPNNIVAYKFDFGDGQGTGWKNISFWTGTIPASHRYNQTGTFQIEFFVKLANGQVLGGGGTYCAVAVNIN